MPSPTLAVSDQDHATLESWTRSSTVSDGQRERALIVLSVVDGTGVSGTARALGVSRPTVIKWRDRFAVDGVNGLTDLPRSGRPKTIDDAQIIAATLDPPPASLAVTHWSTRLLGRHLGISDATVARAWRAYRVQPWRHGTFKFSTDPELEAKVRDVIGLYLDPPANAIVLCVDDPTSSSWLNMVEIFFGQLTDKAIRRGIFHSVPDLIDAIETYLAPHNENPEPFTWTATTDKILEKVRRGRITLDAIAT
jgi:transposase